MLKMGKNKKSFADRFVSKGMDFWFYDKNTIKVFRLGIILVTIAIWIFIPLYVVNLFGNYVYNRSFFSLAFAVLITYSFFGILHGLKNVNNLLKRM